DPRAGAPPPPRPGDRHRDGGRSGGGVGRLRSPRGEMTVEERHQRADAARNRKRLLEAAQTLFRERGLDVSVSEIAEAAGVGRGTLFRNFASKEDLIAAVVAERMHDACEIGRALLSAPDPGDALFEFLSEMMGRQQLDRAVFEALDDTWLAREEIRTEHAE